MTEQRVTAQVTRPFPPRAAVSQAAVSDGGVTALTCNVISFMGSCWAHQTQSWSGTAGPSGVASGGSP